VQLAGEAAAARNKSGGVPDGNAIIQFQVLEVATVEAERRILESDK